MRLKKSQIEENIKRSISDLEEHIAELEVCERVQANALNNEFVKVIVKQAVEEAQATLKNAKLLVDLYHKLDR